MRIVQERKFRLLRILSDPWLHTTPCTKSLKTPPCYWVLDLAMGRTKEQTCWKSNRKIEKIFAWSGLLDIHHTGNLQTRMVSKCVQTLYIGRSRYKSFKFPLAVTSLSSAIFANKDTHPSTFTSVVFDVLRIQDNPATSLETPSTWNLGSVASRHTPIGAWYIMILYDVVWNSMRFLEVCMVSFTVILYKLFCFCRDFWIRPRRSEDNQKQSRPPACIAVVSLGLSRVSGWEVLWLDCDSCLNLFIVGPET